MAQQIHRFVGRHGRCFNRPTMRNISQLRHPFLLAAGAVAAISACSGTVADGPQTGDTDFTTEEAGNNNGVQFNDSAARGGAATGAAPSTESAKAPAPGGRVADVEEGDIYKIDGTRLFYFNTYRGFVVYDVADPKKPVRVSRLPVFGYPVEMFVDGTTVYALLRDSLYLTQAQGKLQFERRNVSQLVSIDVSDVANPRVLKTVDIIGQLREGVSRKIEKTVYVVSYIPQSYQWGWSYPGDTNQQKEQAWVYSFDVSDPRDVKMVEKLQLFEGGSINFQKDGASYNRDFGGVAISATSNALMVVENWNVYAYNSGGRSGCGFSGSDQQAKVSIVDVSDPRGDIRVHTKFETTGALGDQFKMTYVFDERAKTGTFYGIFARRAWFSANCNGGSEIRNTIESWDVTNGAAPAMLSRLDFGKPNETVRGSTFDVERNVAYAITARAIDPLYAISLADRKNLRVLSAIDGLSGDMNVFRLIANKQFLIGIGQDNSGACTGFQSNQGWAPTKIAVSIIDVRDLSNVRLVQRRCVAIKNADWVGSNINWNLDQAHKMIGMHSDATANVVTVPVYYHKRNDPASDWWYYRYETAVGIMGWDVARYDARRPPADQSVIENYGTFVHPHGQVERSIVFTHAGTGRRTMINLSDTHVSVADLQDLNNPQPLSTVELAPYLDQIYRFGDYMIEHVQSAPSLYGPPSQGMSEFRVKRVGGELEDQAVVAAFSVGQVQRVIKHGNSLVLFRGGYDQRSSKGWAEALVWDLRDPTKPRAGGRTRIPEIQVPYTRYYCGLGAYWSGYWFDNGSDWTTTDSGLVFVTQVYDQRQYLERQTHPLSRLVVLDLRNVDAPKVELADLGASTEWGVYGLTADPGDPKGFYLTYRVQVGSMRRNDGNVFTRYKYYAQRWERSATGWAAAHAINLPGRLVKTWIADKGERLFVAQDYSYRWVTPPQGQNTGTYEPHTRLAFLRQINGVAGPLAQLLGNTHTFGNISPSALVVDGDKLFVNGHAGYFGYASGSGVARGGDVAVAAPGGGAIAPAALTAERWETDSDRLVIFDLSRRALDVVYDQPMRAYNVQLMGTHQGRLFVNLQGDGILMVDVTKPSQPVGVRFLRTLGYASHIEFAGDDAYVAAGYFGVYRMDLRGASEIPVD